LFGKCNKLEKLGIIMHQIIIILHILACIGLIVFVLLQKGKGAEAGAAFGSGASSTVFGSRGSASFLTRVTAALATVFFITSLTLAYFSNPVQQPQSVTETIRPVSDMPPVEIPITNDMPPSE
jgi:preprotein translocase subunit SecG